MIAQGRAEVKPAAHPFRPLQEVIPLVRQAVPAGQSKGRRGTESDTRKRADLFRESLPRAIHVPRPIFLSDIGEVLSSRGIRTGFRDSDPSDSISESSGEIEWEASSDSDRSSGNRGISSARRIDEELSLSSEMPRLINSSECKPKGRASSETIINEELSSDVVSSGSNSVIIRGINRGDEYPIKLRDIRDDEIRALVFNPIRAIRQDDDRHTAGMGIRDNRLAEALSADTLFIIGEDNGVEGVIEGAMAVI